MKTTIMTVVGKVFAFTLSDCVEEKSVTSHHKTEPDRFCFMACWYVSYCSQIMKVSVDLNVDKSMRKRMFRAVQKSMRRDGCAASMLT